MSKKVILTGLRANNDLHIGNYFGALLPIIDMANTRSEDYEINLFIPDLHSFTTPIDHNELQAQIMNNLRVFVAAGLPLDNPNVHIYRQSRIPAHSELTWILSCFTGFGELLRMTQFKDKTFVNDRDIQNIFEEILKDKYPDLFKGLQNATDREYEAKLHGDLLTIYHYVDDAVREQSRSVATAGFFNYPVLMAADILLYNATYVPVGDDQTQHLEFTRDIAQRMNSKFNQELFTVPVEVKQQHAFFGKDQGLRIKNLVNPTKKMSKSDESDRGAIFLSDDPENAKKKIKSATTDDFADIQYDPDSRPGISNLLQILALLRGQNIQETASKYAGQAMYGTFKEDVGNALAAFLTDFQTKLASVDNEVLQTKLLHSERKMAEVANETLLRVQKAVGLR